MKDHQLNLLQLVNATLSAAVFVSLGEGLVKAFPEPLHGVGPTQSSAVHALMAVILVLWTVKIFLDDHSSFRNADRKLASYIALFFTIISYLLLIGSAAAIASLLRATEYLALHFLLLVVWVLVAIFLRLVGLEDALDGHGSKRDFQLRLGWLGLNLVYAALAWWASLQVTQSGALLPLAALLVVMLLDAWFSGTFTNLTGGAATDLDTPEPEPRV